jgi:hypothetical protein
MDNNIGVGAIVGLAFASSLYVWNSNSFTKGQKTVLLICIIFPPAQWLGILIVLGYNNYKESNSSEKVAERKVNETKTKLELTISSLTELNEKGILTDEEFKSKVEKIEAEKEEQNLKNSTEYKQLKSLLDSGVLTKEEFESKIQLLQNVSEKEVNVLEISKIINSATKIYSEQKAENIEHKKEHDSLVLGIMLFFVVLGILLIYLSQ